MLGSAGAQSQVIGSLGSEAVSLFNHLKNIAVSGCSSCYQQRQYPGRRTKHPENNLNKITTEKEAIPVKNENEENQTSSSRALYDELGLQHLPENWADLVSLVAVEPAHANSDSVWKRSYVSANSFYENKHGFSEQTSRNSSSASWRLFHPHSTQLLRRHTTVNVSNTVRRHLHSMERIRQLEENANFERENAQAQGMYLQAVLMKDPEFVIRRYESGLFASNDYCRRTYLKALELSGRIGGAEVHSPQPSSPRQKPIEGSDEQNPVVIKELDDTQETFTSEGFATLKYLLLRAFVAMLIISTVEIGLDKWVRSPPEINKYEVLPENSKNIKFSDVRGASEAKQELKEIVEFLKDPKRFQYIGGRMPAGVLLTGPPGVGKTLLAKAVAGEAGVPFFYASGSNFEEMYVGVGAARIRKLFEAAKMQSPAIIFIDEIDAIGGKRVPTDHQPYSNMTMNQLLTELDGFEKDNMVVVIAATNFIKSLDPALTRPGRFDTLVSVDAPYITDRKDILDLYVSKIKAGKDVSVDKLARTTAGFTGADLANLVNQAALKAASDGEDVVHMNHFEYAKDKHLLGARRTACVMSDEVKFMVATYEAGRALIALKNPKSVPVYKGTIIPRGSTLGNVTKIPDNDRMSLNKQQVLAIIEFHLGGLAAHEVCFGKEYRIDHSSTDLANATQYARQMVSVWCMSDKVGYRSNSEDVSDTYLQVIDEEVERVLQECYQRAKKVVSDHKLQHRRLADALIKHETLSQAEMKLAMEGKPIEDLEF